eukprot:TRINITY_DN23297_c0_g1_i1.p1 TRINITY_DN23297_c0_g1~~TRINITY_DN23297_c0_g1_i1.p1  ORF type:complete len:567 (-),score=145.41 TRINITY_DN23297_c0_g1_i1:201-1901(-)
MWLLFSFLLFPLVFCSPKQPSVFISILVRNKAHTLPYFLSLLEKQTYPKSRIILYLRSDNNQDQTIDVLDTWLSKIGPKHEYHDIIKDFRECDHADCLLEGESSPVGWSDTRFEHIMNLRQKSLELARFSLADFYFSLDADVFLTNARTLEELVTKDLLLAAPLLSSIGLYSNFWGGMSDTYYYERTEDYRKILDHKMLGCFEVPMVHTCVLINLRHSESDLLTFLPENIPSYPGPMDDIIVFALSASLRDIPLHVCNDQLYGTVMIPLEDDQELEMDKQVLLYTLMEVTARSDPISVDPLFNKYVQDIPDKTKLGMDNVYLINLERRPDRYSRMKYNLDLIGVDFQLVPAVDGRLIDQNYLIENNIKMLPEFSEPYHGRPLTFGEIGCFMSHHKIWKDMIASNYDTIVVFEDDIRFEPYFIQKLDYLLTELKTIPEEWDLVFLGRKILHNSEEPWLQSSSQLVMVDYTYWTLSYILTRTGAQKLLAGDPLTKMVPVDEYIPIMYNRHPNETWKSYFPKRDLHALSVHPLLVFPTHYTGEEGYISDTEGTSTIKECKECKDKKDEL